MASVIAFVWCYIETLAFARNRRQCFHRATVVDQTFFGGQIGQDEIALINTGVDINCPLLLFGFVVARGEFDLVIANRFEAFTNRKIVREHRLEGFELGGG